MGRRRRSTTGLSAGRACSRPPKPSPRDRHLTHVEIGRLLAADCEPYIALAITLMLSTAARVTAVLELTWDRVDMIRGQIDLRRDTTGPRKSRAVVPMKSGARAALTAAKEAALSDQVIEWAGGAGETDPQGVPAGGRLGGPQGCVPAGAPAHRSCPYGRGGRSDERDQPVSGAFQRLSHRARLRQILSDPPAPRGRRSGRHEAPKGSRTPGQFAKTP